MASQQDQILPRLQESSGKIVGLISDTHVPVRAKEIPKQVFKVFENVDYIMHAGDLVELSVVDELEQIAPVLVVYGNMDGPDIRSKLTKVNSLKVFDWKIGVMHNPGALFGTSVKWEGDVLLVNPGSPTNPAPPFIAKPSVGLLRITKEKIVPQIIQI
jgi:predicted phosphodiesterase